VKSKAVKRPEAVTLEEDDNDDHDYDHDHDKAMKLEDDGHDHDMICDHDKLSHNMAQLLRHAAYKEQLLDEDGWLPLRTALPQLHCTEAEATKAVEQSDRHDDDWGLGARFEINISGSRAWIRATDVAYYRDRFRRAQ
jgi:RNA:NAD 2'-phosphotransferase (TPT1/KptA family)